MRDPDHIVEHEPQSCAHAAGHPDQHSARTRVLMLAHNLISSAVTVVS